MTITELYTPLTVPERVVAKTIDHSLLKPQLTVADVLAGCEIAASYDVASVCCRPIDVARCRDALAGTDVLVGTVISFPHGDSVTATKVFETQQALADGAVEFDVVIPIGLLRSGEDDYVRDDIAAVVAAAEGHVVKVILENTFLTNDEKVRGCRLSEAAGASYVKTSTGYAESGATIDDLKLMRAAVSPHVKVKAAHGIRTLEGIVDCINVGVDRVGATATAAIIDDLRSRQAR